MLAGGSGGSTSSSPGACSAIFSISSTWDSGNSAKSASLNLYLQSTGPSDIAVPYTLSFTNPSWTGLVNTWNFQASSPRCPSLRETVSTLVIAAISCLYAF